MLQAARIASVYNEMFNFENGSETEEVPYTPPDTDGLPASLRLALPRLLNIRKMSDHGIRQLRNQIRRMSNLSNRLPRSWNGARTGESPSSHSGSTCLNLQICSKDTVCRVIAVAKQFGKCAW